MDRATSSSLSIEEAAFLYVGALVDELVASGVHHLIFCPGSRSTPVALMAFRDSRMRLWQHVDERSAAFFAGGMAKSLGEPVALLSTSGTAACNFLPAIVEARYSRVPLVVLTADRPHELRNFGALQTIDQIHLYGKHVKWFADLALPEGTTPMLRYMQTMAAKAIAKAKAAPKGPVHLNLPFREPLVPKPPKFTVEKESGLQGDNKEVLEGRQVLEPSKIEGLAEALLRAERGLIVAGPVEDAELAERLVGLAKLLGYPILADPLSQLRAGSHDRSYIITTYDSFLRSEDIVRKLRPGLVLRFGMLPLSKPLSLYFKQYPQASHWVVDEGSEWRDPMHLVSHMLYVDPASFVEELLRLAKRKDLKRYREEEWLKSWMELERKSVEVITKELKGMERIFEGKVFQELTSLLPDGAVLYVGSSMPIRDLESFFLGSESRIRILANRGTNGIDGIVSSALGVATAKVPVVLVLGDLSFYHDLNGLLAAKLHSLQATIILVNNDGGGIFSFLPQAELSEAFEPLFGTPTGLDFRPAVEMYGGHFIRVEGWEEFRSAVAQGISGNKLTVIEIRTNRKENFSLHRHIWSRVEEAVAVKG